MIRYTLRCADGHDFESWFQSAGTYDRLRAAGGLSCAVCGSPEVEKALMAPRVAPARRKASAPAAEEAARPLADAPAPAADDRSTMLSAPGSPLEAALRALREKVEASAENVGRDFPRLAREMHEGETEDRPIYGEATRDEARELIEDGVPVAPLPWTGRKTN
ncbi:MAG: DUF1178 family protein [Pseudomonadota bacterium]|nr:DUF1178 family protein [Pseudomonadota bacterium]MEE3100484.1 DUF1178 family protein [Pseudomonadota bacterium]